MDNEIKEDEDKKFNLTLRNLEQKIKILEESREQVQKNNIELQRKLVKNEKVAAEQ